MDAVPNVESRRARIGGARRWLSLVFRKRRRKTGGPQVLVWVLAFYAAAQLGILAVKDRWRAIGPLHETKKWPRLRQLANGDPKQPLALMGGSQRVRGAFQAGRLNGLKGPEGESLHFYNFGIPATGVIHSLLYVRDMIKEGIRPRVLLVEYLVPLLCEPHGSWPSEEYFAAMPWTSHRDL